MQRFKPKRRLKKRALFKFLLLLVILFLFFQFLSNILYTNSNNILKLVINDNFKNNDSNIFNKVYEYTSNNFINNPKNLLLFKYNKEDNNVIKKDDSKNLEDNSSELIEEEKKQNEDVTKIYIYSTHQKEDYKKDYMEDYNVVPGVYLASLLMQEKLNELNIKTEVMKDDITAYLNNNNLDYSRSYDASRYYLKSVVEKNKDIKLFIDLHRDAAPKDATTTWIDNKAYAKVMFVIGKEYNTYKENLQVAEKINDKIKNLYPNLTRGILQKSGYGVNGVYNQDLKNNIILIELGGNENNIEEVSNTIEVLIKILGEYINEEKKEE